MATPTQPGRSPFSRREVAERLIALKERIIERWVKLVRAEVPAAREQDRPLLIDSLPFFLEDIADALRSELEDACAVSDACQLHAEQRAHLAEYSLEQVVREHTLLRRAVLEELEMEALLDLDARLVLHTSIDHGIQAAAARFTACREEALREADQRKNEFLAMLAHELRNPLGAIVNALYVLDQLDLQDERALRQVALAGRQGRQLSRLVDDLMDVSRVSRGKLELRRETVNLAAVVEAAVQTCRPLAEARGHQLTVHLPPGEVLVEGDPLRLEQVLGNLLTNAARYSEDGGLIRVTLEAGSGEAVIRVRDTGIGIPPEVLPRLFDLFSQASPSSTRSQDGLGIGLTLVKRLVELHGGTVTAHSPGHGQGSEFTVRLPLAP